MAAEAASNRSDQPWQVWIDTGGTFTDCLARDPQGVLHRAKVLSHSALRGRIGSPISSNRLLARENWGACDDLIAGWTFRVLSGGQPERRVVRYQAESSILDLDRPLDVGPEVGAAFEVQSNEPAAVVAARLLTGTPTMASLPPVMMRLATTRGTNALLERLGAPVALFITQGFADLLVIGDQRRPDLFAIKIQKPPPLYQHVVEVCERVAADGSVLLPLDLDQLQADAQRLLAQGIRVAAVALMHSHFRPAHERRVAKCLRELGFDHVSISSELAPLIRLLPRAQTSVVDAYLGPAITGYLRGILQNISDPFSTRENAAGTFSLHVMSSGGGLVRSENFRACDSLFSGPAGGVVGAAAAGRQSGFNRIISFDMGGTSTDVARFDGDFDYRFEQCIAGVQLMVPALAIETVAAGGGSICEFIDDRLTVGPRSAGADPGPACYGAGGPLTLTDVNLLLGRLDPRQFEIPIQLAAAQKTFDQMRVQVASAQPAKPQANDEALLQGLVDIADERMAAAIENISIRQGYDPKEFAMMAFGGAGGQHACAVAERLGIQTIIMPAEAALLSALGLGQAVLERFAQRQVLQRLDECAPRIDQWIAELAQQAVDEVESQGVKPDRIAVRRIIVNLRLLGQDSTLAIDLEPVNRNGTVQPGSLEESFAQRYHAVYGHVLPQQPSKPIEVESIRVAASSIADPVPATTQTTPAHCFAAAASNRVRACFDGQWTEVPAYDRTQLKGGARVDGPALVLDRRSACIISPGWAAVMDSAGALVVRRTEAHDRSGRIRPDLIQLELFSNRFAAIAEEMGHILQRTALSTNIKERLDFSCAVLNHQGELIVNAPHIPVHLGALGMCVRAVRDELTMDDGDVVVTNHPAFGGSHLPDLTVITPVFEAGDPRCLIGYVASRAHHAEIGGIRPGSMPPSATRLIEEGVVIRPRYLVRKERDCVEELQCLLRGKPYPSRAVEDNIADVRAAVAANHRGALALRSLVDQHGAATVAAQMAAITSRAERLTRAALAQLPKGQHQAIERLDDGSPIQVVCAVEGEQATIDFTGSAPVHPGNLNATPAIVHGAVMYVLRLLIGERLPLNEGILRAVHVKIPQSMLNPPFDDDPARSPAVVGGNTETSQRLVDALLKALTMCACSQGTMNNVLFGNQRLGYYETVCGGCGAGPGFHGAHAVHSHMTNTRITDPEIIEHRYPVRAERFAIRRGSGGAGRWRGGDGVVREFTFLEPMSLSILSQHRREAPYGMEGGQAGAPGRQHLMRANGEIIQLNAIDGAEVASGDRLILETPGGGGWGSER